MSQSVPRITQEKLPPELAGRLAPRIQRLGYLGEFFQCMAHQPEVLLSFMDFTDNLKEALPDNLTEVVALTAAVSTGNDYERNQHERLCEKLGFSREWIREVLSLSPDSGNTLSAEEKATQHLTGCAIKHAGRNCTQEFEALCHEIGHKKAVGVLFLIGRYLCHSIVVNTLGLKPPVPSIFGEAGR